MVMNEYVVTGLCQFRCCCFSVCPVVCKWNMFPDGDCSDNDLKGYKDISVSVLSQDIFILNLYTIK